MIDRVRLLIRQVSETLPDKPGRMQAVARKVGISPSMLSKIAGEQKAHLRDDVIADILESMQLDPAFLFDADLGEEPDHREFVRRPKPKAPPPPPHWQEFAASWHRFGELSTAEREGLQRMISEDHEIRDWTDWIPAAEWVLAKRRRS